MQRCKKHLGESVKVNKDRQPSWKQVQDAFRSKNAVSIREDGTVFYRGKQQKAGKRKTKKRSVSKRRKHRKTNIFRKNK